MPAISMLKHQNYRERRLLRKPRCRREDRGSHRLPYLHGTQRQPSQQYPFPRSQRFHFRTHFGSQRFPCLHLLQAHPPQQLDRVQRCHFGVHTLAVTGQHAGHLVPSRRHAMHKQLSIAAPMVSPPGGKTAVRPLATEHNSNSARMMFAVDIVQHNLLYRF